MEKTNRRTFLKQAGLLSLFTIVPSKVLGGPRHIAPSDQLTKGIIGVGGIGRSGYHFNSNEACRLVSVCDVDSSHLQKALDMGKEKLNLKLQGYHDYRDLIHDSNVDIVHIATPPHWHGIMAVEAANAGKDIWCEKPMTRTIGKARRRGRKAQQPHFPPQHMVPLYRQLLWPRHHGRAAEKARGERTARLAA